MLTDKQLLDATRIIVGYFMVPEGDVPWERVPQYDAWEFGSHRCTGHTMRQCLAIGMVPAPYGPMTERVGF
jgi:hypothetical protein